MNYSIGEIANSKVIGMELTIILSAVIGVALVIPIVS